MHEMPKFQFVDLRSNDALNALPSSKGRIGLDTEFMREKTFYPQLCLVQIATNDDILCVDPMGISRLDSFWHKLMDCNWVVHSARQDIEALFHASIRMPRSIFDTQIAAGLLGMAPQLGYAGLVEELFGIVLTKSHTRADWTRRPLSTAALEYAAEDVEYLLPAYELLTERLVKLNRLSWAKEDSSNLLEPSLYKGNSNQAINRLKGSRNLQGRTRAAAVRLASWREDEAKRYNRPRQWIMKDAILLDIARINPQNQESLATIPGLAPRTVHRTANALLQILGEAQNDHTEYEPLQKSNKQQKGILKDMLEIVSACAEQLGVVAEIIASKKELSTILHGNQNSRVFTGWRREIIGKKLLEMLKN
jgi:ribonuclease D